MKSPYGHTQVGYVILGGTLGAGIVGLLPAVLVVESPGPSLWFGGGMLSAVALLFSNLTVRVDDETLVGYFGPHFWTNTLPLSRIDTDEPGRLSSVLAERAGGTQLEARPKS